jgi:hypothetical protein
MKWVSCILLVILTCTVLTPFSPISLIIIDGQEQPVLGNLDVCTSAAPALSSTGDMPCVTLHSFDLPIPLTLATSDTFHPVFTEVVFTAPSEHPPKA